jgi:Tfp pilus assembly protein PilP
MPYEARGRRDPFKSPAVEADAKAEPKKGPAITSMKLVGVLQGRQGPLALVEAPDGFGYILRLGETLGDGLLTEIGTESATFSVAGRPGSPPGAAVLKLRPNGNR